MRIGQVIGRVTLSRQHAAFQHPRFLIVRPMTLEALAESSDKRGEELIVYDDLGASPGALIAISEGREAANPFGKRKTPVDAYCACLLDHLEVENRS